MGFRCPLCNKDFGKNKEEFATHPKTCCFGMAEKFINKVRSIYEEKKDDEVVYEKSVNDKRR